MSGYLRVGLPQWTPGPDAGVNLGTAEAAVYELAGRGCQLVVLPELWLCGYRTATLGPDARAAAEPLDGPVQRRLAAAARAAGLVLCAGSFPEADGGQLFNTAVIYGPDGELLLWHRKACLYGSEPAVFQPGRAVTVGDIGGGAGRTASSRGGQWPRPPPPTCPPARPGDPRRSGRPALRSGRIGAQRAGGQVSRGSPRRVLAVSWVAADFDGPSANQAKEADSDINGQQKPADYRRGAG